MSRKVSRRFFLASSGSASLAVGGVLGFHTSVEAKPSTMAIAELGVGAIGLRYQGSVITHKAQSYANIVAVCDVDRNVRDQAKASFGSTAYSCEDYRDLLKKKNVDVVLIATPDHWHTKMILDACQAGKDVYCEKPLTLTVSEGQQLAQAIKPSERVVQVGSWQRSDDRFRLAVEMVRAGRIGTLKKVDVVLGKNATSDSLIPRSPPAHLNWNLWQGQTPNVPYIEERSHYTFRWWFEYSGGQMTDWGAHHVDIAQWAINAMPIEFRGSGNLPRKENAFNVPIDFGAQVRYANGVEMTISDHGENGIMFTGDAGRIFVNRGKISGAPVEALSSNPFPRDAWKVYDFDNFARPPRSGKLDSIINHMGNFFDCVQSRRTPISDIVSQHRSISTCHLANIAIRLGRTLKWNPEKELFVDDPQANQWLQREQRKGFETTA